MENTDQSTASTFRDLLAEAVGKQQYVRVHYYSALHELLKTASVLKALQVSGGEEVLVLASGEEIPVGRLVRLGNMPAPGHEGDDFYNCSCG